MGLHAVDLDLDNLYLCPKEWLGSVFWELPDIDPAIDPAFHKEEWFSSTLLEWGPCGKLLVDGDEVRGVAQYGPATLFAGLGKFPWVRISPDAIFLPYCFVTEGHRNRGLGAGSSARWPGIWSTAAIGPSSPWRTGRGTGPGSSRTDSSGPAGSRSSGTIRAIR